MSESALGDHKPVSIHVHVTERFVERSVQAGLRSLFTKACADCGTGSQSSPPSVSVSDAWVVRGDRRVLADESRKSVLHSGTKLKEQSRRLRWREHPYDAADKAKQGNVKEPLKGGGSVTDLPAPAELKLGCASRKWAVAAKPKLQLAHASSPGPSTLDRRLIIS